jgi:uncharacterized repeat protein (TIGR03803 family)
VISFREIFLAAVANPIPTGVRGTMLQDTIMFGVVVFIASAVFDGGTANAVDAPKETVLHSFAAGIDGYGPQSDLISDSSGTLYGTTPFGGTSNAGTVYKLTPPGKATRGLWIKTLLHTFSSAPDGVQPYAGLTFDSSGALYGTTVFGGNPAFGTVYKLTPPTTGAGSLWETVIYSFTGGSDGGFPSYAGTLTLDSGGSLYGTTEVGGSYGFGTVYKLTPPTAGTVWSLSVLHNFPPKTPGNNGGNPTSGVIFDSSGALYGTTVTGGTGSGTVYRLTPPAAGGTPWIPTVLYTFTGGVDGQYPYARPTFDRHGVLYGTTRSGGGLGWGTVYMLAPPAAGGAPWLETVLYSFSNGTDGSDPFGYVVASRRGALYGTTREAGLGYGVVYKLKAPATGGTPWKQIVLYSFSGGVDGANPWGGLIFGQHHTLYGTTEHGGNADYGTVFKIE